LSRQPAPRPGAAKRETDKDAQRAQRRAAAKAERAAALDQRRRRGRVRRLLLWAGVALVAGFLVLRVLAPEVRAWLHPATAVASMGGVNVHTATETFAYNSRPPTSGPHAPSPPAWGRSAQPIPPHVQVHGLEHGGVLIQYRCPEGCADLERQLESVVRRYRSKVLMAPNLDQDALIALTAWTRLQTLDAFDEATIVDFIETFRDRGPEKTPD
jgi:hypothetical protein